MFLLDDIYEEAQLPHQTLLLLVLRSEHTIFCNCDLLVIKV
jgi:hypothetical protein